MTVSISLAFLAGLASFLSPCVFSLVPVYIGYLSGRSVSMTQNGETVKRFETFLHGLAFVFGFSIVFILLGLTVSVIGGFLYGIKDVLTKIGGIVVVAFGLHMSGIVQIPFLYYDLRPRSSIDRQRSYFSSFLMGIFFSAGWSPCVGPVLGAILTLALNEGNMMHGFQLLLAYSVGMAIPFLLAALGIGWVTHLLRRYQKILHFIEVGMGLILILVGGMLFFGVFEQIAQFGPFINFGL